MRFKLIILILASFITTLSLLAWSYYASKTSVEFALKTNPKTAKLKLMFCGANLRPINTGDGKNKIRLAWQLSYTSDQFVDLVVYVSLVGNIYFDDRSLIKVPVMN